MKSFHVHIAVEDLAASVRFYSNLFGHAPSKQQPDYAKWMLDEPRLNFAISMRGHAPGLNHFGFQVDSPEELAALERLAHAASGEAPRSSEATCCYARSKKHWTIDPQGLAWEHFQTTSDATAFGSDNVVADAAACCDPLRESAHDSAQAGCCVANAGAPCCT
jgi:catechol 2,3-dioxygenase-like lactoylglutathione lyase family enzyme